MTMMTAAPLGPSRVLVVEDDRVTRAQLAFLLQRAGYEVATAENGQAAIERIGEGWFPLVLTDWSMPEMDGPTLCHRIRNRGQDLYTYVIMLTGRCEKNDLMQGLDAGVDDYITKPFDADELLARLRVGHRILGLHMRMRETERRLRDMADRDGLTGVLNRRAVDARLEEAFNYARRLDRPLSVALLDLDHFKRVNDEHGHQIGDAVLVEAARRFEGTVRSYDSIGRYGGEEFLLILPDAVPWSARLVAERVRHALYERPVVSGDLEVRATVSIGVASFDPRSSATLQRIVETADGALYEAKQRGRNLVVSALFDERGCPQVATHTLDLGRRTLPVA